MRLVAASAGAVAVTLALAAPTRAALRYTVQPGDTLTLIAARHHLPLRSLLRANHMRLGDVLFAGAVIRLPCRSQAASGGLARYRVRPGDSLSLIAARHGTTLARLARLNHLNPLGVLLVGTRLRVPARRPVVAAASAVASTGTAHSALPSSDVPASIDQWSAHYGVDRRLARALAWQESGFQQSVVSTAGASGVMQITPSTWSFVEDVLLQGRKVSHDANGNVRIGVAFLHHLLNVFGGNERLAVGAYYQGIASVQARGLLPETQQYVANVLALKQRM